MIKEKPFMLMAFWNSHGYYTRNSSLIRLSNRKTNWGKIIIILVWLDTCLIRFEGQKLSVASDKTDSYWKIKETLLIQELQLALDESNFEGKPEKVRVRGSSKYREMGKNNRTYTNFRSHVFDCYSKKNTTEGYSSTSKDTGC